MGYITGNKMTQLWTTRPLKWRAIIAPSAFADVFVSRSSDWNTLELEPPLARGDAMIALGFNPWASLW